jgi:hypothetical protein
LNGGPTTFRPKRERARAHQPIFFLIFLAGTPSSFPRFSLFLSYRKLYTPLLPLRLSPPRRPASAAPTCTGYRTKRGVRPNLVPGKHKAFVSCFFFPKIWFRLRLDPNNFSPISTELFHIPLHPLQTHLFV